MDILVVSETKLDISFPAAQFHLPGFNSFRYDRKSTGGVGGGIIVYIRDDIPSKELKSNYMPNDIEGYFIELNLRRKNGFYLLVIIQIKITSQTFKEI